MNKLVQEISTNSKAAVSVLNSMSTESKNNLLIKATKNIHQSRKKILLANNLDVEDALQTQKTMLLLIGFASMTNELMESLIL